MFPNQTWTINQAIDFQVHGAGPPADNVWRVNSKPEKQIAAIQMKKTNSAIMARKALNSNSASYVFVVDHESIQNHDIVLDSEEREPGKRLALGLIIGPAGL